FFIYRSGMRADLLSCEFANRVAKGLVRFVIMRQFHRVLLIVFNVNCFQVFILPALPARLAVTVPGQARLQWRAASFATECDGARPRGMPYRSVRGTGPATPESRLCDPRHPFPAPDRPAGQTVATPALAAHAPAGDDAGYADATRFRRAPVPAQRRPLSPGKMRSIHRGCVP